MPQEPIYNLTLILLTGKSAPEGPGWYITGTATQIVDGEPVTGSNLQLRRVSVPDAEDVARSFEQLIPTNVEGIGIRPYQLVREGSKEAREAIQQALNEAEEIATTVPRLRKALGELGGE